ncbi:MAG: glycerol-3-phosphate 1-O-acyltransferase PlsY [Planctomycetota bacterium]|jgi:glycerol-3-phosphate acyltransferase PlsY
MEIGRVLLMGLGAYLVGGIPVGYLVGMAKGVNIRKIGSGNIGAANVGRNLGFHWGVAVFVLDVIKGALPTALYGFWLGGMSTPPLASEYLAWLLVGICPVLGHNFSPFLGFHGGKGVATSLGVALAVYPHLTVPALISFAVWAVVVLTIRISSLGSMLAAVAFPVGYVVLALFKGWGELPRWPFVSFTTFASIMVLVLHRSNITRLISGQEARLVASSQSGEEKK